jgi:ADP-ribose pyrophosphatase YjhB (NUDIX family)
MGTFPQSPDPLPAALVFLKHPDRDALLFIRRSKEPFKGLYGLPGGRMKTGEHPAEAAWREIIEEAGTGPASLSVIAVVSEIFTASGKPEFQTILFLAEAKAETADVKPGAEGELRWLDLANLDEMRSEIIPTDYAFIREIHINKKRGVFRSVVSTENGWQMHLFEPEP